jgi:hypothetical protein
MLSTRHGLRLFAELLGDMQDVRAFQASAERCCASRAVGSTINLDDPVIIQVREMVTESVAPFGFGNGVKAPSEVSAADAAVSKALHDGLRGKMTVGVAGDTQVWTALALAVVPEYVRWRWVGRVTKLEDRVAVRSRHMLGRLWWRAQMAFDGKRTHAYELLAMKEQFWNQVEERTSLYQEPDLVHDIMVEASRREMSRDELSAAMQAIRAQRSYSCLAALPAALRRAVVAKAFNEHAPLLRQGH